MASPGILQRHWPTEPVDDSTFESAPLVFTTEVIFDAPVDIVWKVFDSDGRARVTWQIALKLRGVFGIGHYLGPVFRFIYRFALRQAYGQIAEYQRAR